MCIRDRTFCIALDLRRVSHPLLEQIKRQVGLVEHDLQIWQEALSDSFKSLISDTFFSKTFFIRALQEHFSDLGKHEAIEMCIRDSFLLSTPLTSVHAAQSL